MNVCYNIFIKKEGLDMRFLAVVGLLLFQGLLVFLVYNILIAGVIVGMIFGGVPVYITFFKSCILGIVLSVIKSIFLPSNSRW